MQKLDTRQALGKDVFYLFIALISRRKLERVRHSRWWQLGEAAIMRDRFLRWCPGWPEGSENPNSP